MNSPEYILTDEMATVVAAVKTALSLTVLNYQYGDRDELNETLKQYEADPGNFDKKFPLVWLQEPYTTEVGFQNIWGIAQVNILIIKDTDRTWKATDRMTNNYKPHLFPIYRSLLDELVLSTVFEAVSKPDLTHKLTKGYYWDKQQEIFNDAVDCLILGSLKLRIHNNQNCTPFKSF